MKNHLFTALLIFFALVSFAQEKPEEKSKEKELPIGEIFTSTQSVTINGKTIPLATETGTLQLRDENDNQ
jgi:hypothetical protein